MQRRELGQLIDHLNFTLNKSTSNKETTKEIHDYIDKIKALIAKVDKTLAHLYPVDADQRLNSHNFYTCFDKIEIEKIALIDTSVEQTSNSESTTNKKSYLKSSIRDCLQGLDTRRGILEKSQHNNRLLDEVLENLKLVYANLSIEYAKLELKFIMMETTRSSFNIKKDADFYGISRLPMMSLFAQLSSACNASDDKQTESPILPRRDA